MKEEAFQKILNVLKERKIENIVIGESLNLKGEENKILKETKDFAEKGISQFPNGKLVMIPKAGHFVQWEKADEVNKLIREFLK